MFSFMFSCKEHTISYSLSKEISPSFKILSGPPDLLFKESRDLPSLTSGNDLAELYTSEFGGL